MTEFATELHRRIADARQALQTAHTAGDLDAERVYAGELDSLLHLAHENGIDVPTGHNAMKPALYEVTRQLPGREPQTTIADAAGVTELIQQAAATGERVHVRPLPEATADE